MLPEFGCWDNEYHSEPYFARLWDMSTYTYVQETGGYMDLSTCGGDSIFAKNLKPGWYEIVVMKSDHGQYMSDKGRKNTFTIIGHSEKREMQEFSES